MRLRPTWQTAILALVAWGASLPIYLFEYNTREGSVPFYVWNLYNHVIAFCREPGRVLTDVSAVVALAIYSIPSFIHIALCLGLGALIHWGLKKLRRNTTPNQALEATGVPPSPQD